MMLNLEPLAAQASLGMTAQGSGSDCDRLITKAAAVLAEQGLFAFGLFLFSRKRNGEPEIARMWCVRDTYFSFSCWRWALIVAADSRGVRR